MARSATQHPPNEGGNTGLRARRYFQSVLVLHLVRHGRSSPGLSADYILLFPLSRSSPSLGLRDPLCVPKI